MANGGRIRLNLRAKWLLGYTMLVVFAAGAMAFGLYYRIRQDQRAALQQRLVDIVSFSVPLVDGDFHALIRSAEDAGSSFHRVLTTRLEDIRGTSQVIRHIYTLRQNPDGSWMYVVDVGAESPAAIGDPFLKESSVLAGGMAWIDSPRVEDVLSVGEDGSATLSGYAPIIDQFQNLDGVLGIEIDASAVIASEKQARVTALLSVLITVPFAWLLGYWLVNKLTLPVKDLMRAAVRVAQGDLESQVPVRSPDELGVLATAFNDMTLQLRETMDGLAQEIREHRRSEQVQDAIYRISQTVVSAESMDDLYRTIHSILMELMPAHNFFIALYDAEQDVLRFPYSVDEFDDDLPEFTPGKGLTAHILHSGKADLITPERFDELLDSGMVELVGTKSVDWLGAPLRVEQEVIGVMATQVYSDEIRFTLDDLELFEFVSTQVAQAIQRKRAETELSASNQRYQNLFEESPVSLWEEDFSEVKHTLDGLQEQGIEDISQYLLEHPDVVALCAAQVKLLDVNRAAVALYGAKSKAQLLNSLGQIFTEESYPTMRQQLVYIADGLTTFHHESVNQTLDGRRMDVSLNWSAVPGYEQDLSRVIISAVDITERRQVEQRIRYMGTHDVMTGLFNRAHFDSEMSRLEAEGDYPVSIIVADLDGLKRVNDTIGHAAGDELLKQAGQILRQSFRQEDTVARIGGDEFGILLPHTDEAHAAAALRRIRENMQQQEPIPGIGAVSLSLGVSTAYTSDELFDIFKHADGNMYAEKGRKQTGFR